MLYVAKRFADGVVGRASMPLSSINSLVLGSVWALHWPLQPVSYWHWPWARRTASKVLEPLNVVGNALQGVLDGTGTPVLEEYQADDELRPILRYIDKLMEQAGRLYPVHQGRAGQGEPDSGLYGRGSDSPG